MQAIMHWKACVQTIMHLRNEAHLPTWMG